MSRRYGDLHLCVNTAAWSDLKLRPLIVAPLGLSQTFMSRALATHQWVTKWAVFLDGLNFASGTVPVCFFWFFFDALHNPWQQSSTEVFSIPSSPSRATRPQFNQFKWRCGVMRALCRSFISFFYSSNNIINFCWCCWNWCILPNWTCL